jgi:hypothetical protein
LHRAKASTERHAIRIASFELFSWTLLLDIEGHGQDRVDGRQASGSEPPTPIFIPLPRFHSLRSLQPRFPSAFLPAAAKMTAVSYSTGFVSEVPYTSKSTERFACRRYLVLPIRTNFGTRHSVQLQCPSHCQHDWQLRSCLCCHRGRCCCLRLV